MTKTTKIIHNIETGEILTVELTADELAQAEIETAESIERLEAETTKENQKAALLEQLGITADQAKLLLS
jgi:hypothetical protein